MSRFSSYPILSNLIQNPSRTKIKIMENREYKGRPSGSPNKVTAEVRKAFATLIERNIKTMQKDLDSLKPKERLEIIIALAKYVVPTIRAIEITSDGDPFAFPSFSLRLDGLGEHHIEENQPNVS